MHEIRLGFLAAAGTARPLVGLAEVGETWDEPSALREMSVGALAAHLVRAVTTVEDYLDKPVKHSEEPIAAAAYYAAMVAGHDLDHPLNVAVRSRAQDLALRGQRGTVELMDATLDRLRGRLAHEPSDRLIQVINDYVLPLDEYLITRIVELVLHTDDLCVSIGRRTPPLPSAGIAIAALVEVAEIRHGELAVLRALARRERDTENVLRVL